MTPYYEQDGITIYHGDCRDVLPALRLPVLETVLCTDPPYGIDFAGRPSKWQRLAGMHAEKWDREPFADVDLLIRSAGVACIWGGNYYALPLSRGWLAWIKPDAPPSMGTFELAWTNIDQKARHIVHSIGATNAERVGHPTQKPLRVMRWCIGGLPEGLVLDPFAGSGTTLLAAKDFGRRAIGIEIEERYCEIAARRLSQGVLFGADVA